MKQKIPNYELINKRCDILEQLGFEIDHTDSRVRRTISDTEFTFDFSAIADDKFIDHAMKCMFEYGKNSGRDDLISGIKHLLKIEPSN